jgi:hypothetical protein
MQVTHSFVVQSIGVIQVDMSLSWDETLDLTTCAAIVTQPETMTGLGILYPIVTSNSFSCYAALRNVPNGPSLNPMTFDATLQVTWPDGTVLQGVLQGGNVCEVWTRNGYSDINQYAILADIPGYSLSLNYQMDTTNFRVLNNPPGVPQVTLTMPLLSDERD